MLAPGKGLENPSHGTFLGSVCATRPGAWVCRGVRVTYGCCAPITVYDLSRTDGYGAMELNLQQCHSRYFDRSPDASGSHIQIPKMMHK